MSKVALILHGWPGARLKDYFLTKYLEEKGYKVLTPNMFVRGYVFSPANVLKEVKRLAEGENIDLIAGISLGGLILPYIAKEYPKSKLIFIASGTAFRTSSLFFNFLVNIFRYSFVQDLAKFFLKLPDGVLSKLYRFASPYKGCDEDEYFYCQDMRENIKLIKSIPLSEEKEIIQFIVGIDNKEILATLDNKSLIFSGKNDLLMPQKGGEELHRLLKNSRLIVSGGEHFDVFGVKELEEVGKFISQS